MPECFHCRSDGLEAGNPLYECPDDEAAEPHSFICHECWRLLFQWQRRQLDEQLLRRASEVADSVLFL